MKNRLWVNHRWFLRAIVKETPTTYVDDIDQRWKKLPDGTVSLVGFSNRFYDRNATPFAKILDEAWFEAFKTQEAVNEEARNLRKEISEALPKIRKIAELRRLKALVDSSVTGA